MIGGVGGVWGDVWSVGVICKWNCRRVGLLSLSSKAERKENEIAMRVLLLLLLLLHCCSFFGAFGLYVASLRSSRALHKNSLFGSV